MVNVVNSPYPMHDQLPTIWRADGETEDSGPIRGYYLYALLSGELEMKERMRIFFNDHINKTDNNNRIIEQIAERRL